MKLRKLRDYDAPLMLEWMHDDSVVHEMGTDFANKTIEDCYAFINQSQKDIPCVHRAIVDDNDEYMGTVSLKNIDLGKRKAEFGIAIRKKAMGRGYSKFGMDEILRIGFQEYCLDTIFWYVSVNNARAIRFYEKNGYKMMNRGTISGGGRDGLYLVYSNTYRYALRLKERKKYFRCYFLPLDTNANCA